MQPRTEQHLSRDANGRGYLQMRQRHIDPALIQARRDRADYQQRLKHWARSLAYERTWTNYHPVHRANG